MERRDFLKFGMSGLTAIVVGKVANVNSFFTTTDAFAATQTIELSMVEAMKEMVDRTPVYMWVYAGPSGPSYPGPVIIATEGDVISLKVNNNLDEDHGFGITGLRFGGVRAAAGGIPIIPPGGSRTFTFRAPKAGSYLYYDPLNAPVNRVLGLHGAFLVLPRGPVLGHHLNPYGRWASISVRHLFDDCGSSPYYPGIPWDGRYRVWVIGNTDPAWNTMAMNGQVINPVDFQQNFLTRYFTMNGHSGVFAATAPDVAPRGMIGEPMIIRILHAGMVTHSLHLHANHFYVLSVNGKIWAEPWWLDVFTAYPMDRIDWLIPFMFPPDIPIGPTVSGGTTWPPTEELNTYLPSLGDPNFMRLSPLVYPMHCHMEMSQSGAGGNYPTGLVTHIEFTGDARDPLNPIVFPLNE